MCPATQLSRWLYSSLQKSLPTADLTENDLEKLGVCSLGHRKKLLRAIEALVAARQPTGTTTAVSNVTGAPSSLVQHGEVEFRQITVLFSDLVGSTQLSENLDPQDLQYAIEAYRAEASKAIAHYGGECPRHIGDGVMAIFKSHEDDAARSIHAALEIVSGVPKISRASYPGLQSGYFLGPGCCR